MKPKHSIFPHHRGFTLVELLVVIVIIAVLASLTFVGVRKAMDSAARAKTTTNMRQLVSTAHIFSADNNAVVLNWTKTRINGQTRNWSEHLLVALSPELATNDDYKKSIGDNYARSMGIFADPKALKKSKDKLPTTGHNSWRTYSYNNRIGSYSPDEGETTPGYVKGPKFAAEVEAPNKMILFGQRTLSETRYHAFLQFHDAKDGNVDFDLHGGSTMVGFYDGHVEMYKKVNYPEKTFTNPSTGVKYTESEHNEYWFGKKVVN